MKTSILLRQTSNMTKVLIAATLLLATLGLSAANPVKVHAAGCTLPATDYGTIDLSVNIPAAGTYRIWTRMAAPSPSSVNNNYLLQIDGTVACYTVGGTTVPVYSSGATTYFANDSSNWIAKTTAGAFVDVSFTTGTHALKLIGNADGVVVDRLILTQDTTCTPTGTGDNCYTPPADTVKPTVAVSSPAPSATVSGTITAVATASDDVGVVKVEGYINSTLFHTEDTAPYTFPLDTTTVPDGDQILTFRAYDAAGNIGIASIHVTVQNGTPTAQSPPVVSISSPAQNASISSTTTVTAVATDDTAVTKVEFFVDGTLKGTDTTVGTGNTFTYSLNPVGLSIGSHTLTAKAYDAQPSSTTSSAVTITIPSSVYNIADVNTDGVVNFLDFSALSGKYNLSGSGLGRSDMNGDGVVNFLDFSILASNYGKTGP